jgi:hypothetical protein
MARGVGRRYFTLAQAAGALPEVVAIVGTLSESRDAIRALAERTESDSFARRAEAEFLGRQVRECAERLTELGVEVKDLDPVLVDFPALESGREICLCWREGESRIAFWHELDTGYAGRRSVAELSTEALGGAVLVS